MDPAQIREWARKRRLGAAREHSEARGATPSPEESFERGLRMIAFAARLEGWPRPEDEHDHRADLAAYERWARLRRLLGGV